MATILVVDDRAPNREFLSTLLGYAGHHMLEADGAEEALRLARATQPDLVISDVIMPVIDGFEFVRRLRGEPAIAHTRVMFYTATAMEAEGRALAKACGVVQLLPNPAEPQVILEIVQATVGMEYPLPQPMCQAGEFESNHERLLLNKLTQKVDELALLNSELEQRVAARTSELSDANSRLRELNTFKDNLLMIASHDLRSPLGAIQNMAEILLEDAHLPDETRRRLTQNIYNSAHRLIDLVRKLLDLSRLEAGKVELEPIQLRASEVARQTLEALQFSIERKSLTAQLIVEPGELPLYADWMKLSQILNNLLTNAIKFTLAGGRIIVTVGPEPGGVRVSIRDTGIGIPADKLPRVFDKFQQIYTRGTANERGTGLGLAIVRQLVELHGGMIEVTSELQHGSMFVVHLPAGEWAIEVAV